MAGTPGSAWVNCPRHKLASGDERAAGRAVAGERCGPQWAPALAGRDECVLHT